MPIAWDESFATGSAVIDRQHRSLLTQVGGLADAMKQGKGRHEIATMLDFLARYVVQHFADEERLMDEVHCPAAAANKRAHAQFLEKYREIKKRFDAAGGGPSLVLEIHDMLTKWLVEHIRGIDVRLRDCVGRPSQEPVGAAARS